MSNFKLKDTILEGIYLVLGTFISALCFNLLLNPQNLVVSGFSGVAIVTEKLFGWSPTIFLYICNLILLIVSLIFLGWKVTKKNIIGSILYPFMVSITIPITNYLSKYIINEDFFIIFLIAIILYGVSSGLVYKSGYTTGGSDIIMQVINKYCHISESKAMVIANAFIIIMGMFVFGFSKGVYSFIILLTSTYFVDKIMFGISDSKVFYISTKKMRKIKKLILDEFEAGFTILSSKGGYSKKNGLLIMCVVPNSDYYLFKQKILEIDPNAFIIINNCYEVNGGVKRSNKSII